MYLVSYDTLWVNSTTNDNSCNLLCFTVNCPSCLVCVDWQLTVPAQYVCRWHVEVAWSPKVVHLSTELASETPAMNTCPCQVALHTVCMFVCWCALPSVLLSVCLSVCLSHMSCSVLTCSKHWLSSVVLTVLISDHDLKKLVVQRLCLPSVLLSVCVCLSVSHEFQWS